jgi:ribosomal protein S18 acetylase RimI-like enzyme
MSSAVPIVRPAVGADLDQLVDLFWAVAAEGRWLGHEVPFDRAARRELYRQMIGAANAALIVADATPVGGPSVVGEIAVTLAPYGVADIGMALARDWRGQGLGRQLLDAAIVWATHAKAHKMSLEVWPHNDAAIALYRRAGFVEEGRKLRHYRRRNGELWDAVLMGLQLGDGDSAQ